MKPCRAPRSARRRIRSGLAAFAVALLLGTLSAPTASADDDDAAESALERGAIAAPAELFDRVAADFGGHVLKLELEHEDGDRAWIYEVKLLLADGQVIKVEYDAATLEILDVAGRRVGDDEDGDAPVQPGQGAQGAGGDAGSPGRGRSSAGAAD